MTNTDRILVAIGAAPGISDSELRQQTGIEPHQQVNQICRRLDREGKTRRETRPDGRIGNYLVGATSAAGVVPTVQAAVRVNVRPVTELPGPAARNALMVLPCSGRKIDGGRRGLDGPSILDLLGSELSARLREARRRLAGHARLDESALFPAYERYTGTLYQSAGPHLANAVRAGRPVIIVSGGYGLVLAEEPIGIYDRAFSLSDWPRGLLEDCLVRAAEALGVTDVIGFCARSTGYADLLRSVRWKRQEVHGWLASPELGARGGGQVLVPRACGQAAAAFNDGAFCDGWTSTDSVAVRLEQLG
jgi:hypothetical protein